MDTELVYHMDYVLRNGTLKEVLDRLPTRIDPDDVLPKDIIIRSREERSSRMSDGSCVVRVNFPIGIRSVTESFIRRFLEDSSKESLVNIASKLGINVENYTGPMIINAIVMDRLNFTPERFGTVVHSSPP